MTTISAKDRLAFMPHLGTRTHVYEHKQPICASSQFKNVREDLNGAAALN